MLVSIIIPLYNREEIVKETLDSVLAQTYPHWECIIVDDVSTDNSLATAQEYAARDSRFKVFQRHREPKGAPTCRNIGLERAEGELIVFFDSDDLMLPYCLENRVKYFIEDETLDLLISFQKSLEDGEERFFINVPSTNHPLVRFYSLKPFPDIPWINNSTIKKVFLLKSEVLWDERLQLYQDIQFNISLLSENPMIKWSEDAFDSYWTFRVNTHSIGEAHGRDFRNTIKILERYLNILRKYDKDLTLQEQMQTQFYAMAVAYLVESSQKRDKDNFKKLMIFFKNNSLFKPWIWVLFTRMHRIVKMEKRNDLHRFFLRKSEAYLSKKFPPIITESSFLKFKDYDLG